jgi:adenosylcobinamide kinase/adenosylcobinamide-phosphate guanylyltransferase
MSSVILITGGCRSGKSAYAQHMAEQISGKRIFIATSPNLDEEMDERIRRHRQDRKNKGWQTIEETCAPAGIIATAAPGTTILLDCLTLWVNNLLFSAGQKHQDLTEESMSRQGRDLVVAAQKHKGSVIIVTNELGLGIVPDNPQARRYRDLAGRCNQVVAAGADQVFLVSCGIPLQLKG